jgi:hypothetical protein
MDCFNLREMSLGMKLIKFFAVTAICLFLGACGGGGDSSGSSSPASGIVGLTLDSPATPTKLYVANADNQTIQVVDLTTNAVTTLAGLAGNAGSTNGTGSGARFYEPFSVTALGGDLYVADTDNYVIRKVTTTGVTTTFAGAAGALGSADGTAARFNLVKGITGAGNYLYVLDTSNQTVRKIDITSAAVTTIAGYAGTVGATDNVSGSSARFNFPFGITVDNSANLYVSDTLNQTIRVISSAGAVTTLAGTTGTSGFANGTGTAATFNLPAGIATDGTNLFVADSGNHLIRKVVISSGVVTTFAGTAGVAGSIDGTGNAAKFNTPTGLTMDNTGNLYVTDQMYSKIRKITSTGVVTTLSATF